MNPLFSSAFAIAKIKTEIEGLLEKKHRQISHK
jgi:hypothetical protein